MDFFLLLSHFSPSSSVRLEAHGPHLHRGFSHTLNTNTHMHKHMENTVSCSETAHTHTHTLSSPLFHLSLVGFSSSSFSLSLSPSSLHFQLC